MRGGSLRLRGRFGAFWRWCGRSRVGVFFELLARWVESGSGGGTRVQRGGCGSCLLVCASLVADSIHVTDLLVIGTGPSIVPLSPTTRKHINDLGIRIEVQ